MFNLSKEQAQSIVDKAKEHGIAFVEDDYMIDDDGNEIYNPTVDRFNAESWLLDLLMGAETKDSPKPDETDGDDEPLDIM